MEFLVIFNSSILPLFLIFGLAYIYNRYMRPDIRQTANLTLMIFAPAFVFDAVVKHHIALEMMVKPTIFMLLLTSTLMILAFIAGKAMNAGEDERATLVLGSSMINVGNFGLPLVYFSFGKEAEASSLLYMMAFNIPLSTVAIYISSKEKKVSRILADVAKIPLFHAFVIAILVSSLSIPVPGIIEKSVGLLAQAAIPMLLFVLGLQLSNIKFRKGYLKLISLATVFRLVVSPVIAYVVLSWINVTGSEFQVAVVQTSAPSALLPLMYAIRFNRSPDLLAAIILTTTILSGMTLSILIKLII